MRKIKIICFAISILLLLLVVNAQDIQKEKKQIEKPLIIKNKAGVYITFEHFGKRIPLRDDEKGKGIWLRLNNNMVYSIDVCGFAVSTNENETVIIEEESTHLGIKYDVILNSVSITEEPPKIKVPTGYNTTSVCSIFEIESGKSLLFAVPKEHLVKGLSIKIPFNYEWEAEAINNPTHYVYFNSLSLPK